MTMTISNFAHNMIERAYNLGATVVRGGAYLREATLTKTVHLVEELIYFCPPIGRTNLNDAIQICFGAAIAINARFLANGLFDSVYGEDNIFNRIGVIVTDTIGVAGIIYLRSDRAPQILKDIDLNDFVHIFRQRIRD